MIPPEREKPLKVVVCDDHHSQALLMKEWLEEAGMEVLGCPHTRELAVLTCAEFKPDVLIMDYAMPGEHVKLSELRERIPDTPILLWTGYDRVDLPSEDVICVSGVLVKGINKEVAVATVRQLAGTGGPPRWDDGDHLPED